VEPISGGIISAAAALVAGAVLARREGVQMRGELFGVPRRGVREQELADLALRR
jgi:hypothetical protein